MLLQVFDSSFNGPVNTEILPDFLSLLPIPNFLNVINRIANAKLNNIGDKSLPHQYE
jgi:hypothetical protein